MSAPLPLADAGTVRRWLGRVARDNRGVVVSMLALFVLASLLGLVGPQLLGVLVQAVAEGRAVPVDALAAGFLAVLTVQTIAYRLAHIRATVAGEQLLATAREEFVEQVLRTQVGTIEAAGTGDLLSRATTDVDRIEYAARYAAPQILTSAITLVLTAGAMLVTSPLLAAGALVSVPLIVVSTRWYRARTPALLERMLAAWGEVQASTTESVTGAGTIEALGLQRRRITHNERAVAGAVATEHGHRSLLTRWLPSLELSYLLPIAAILLLGGWAYSAGPAGLGEITAVVLYALALSEPLNELLIWVEELQIGDVGLRRILGLRELPSDTNTDAVTPRGHSIRIRQVRFCYLPGREVLHGIDLDIPAGERLAIVGPSGSGKSTLARLLAGLSTPDSGAITLGGVDIASWPRDQLRAELLLLTQEHHVFAASVRDNLTLPDGTWSDTDLLRALDIVGAGSWLRTLPEGLDTQLGAGEHAVPPAVAQQLALARVVLADPPVVVLDEATAALDGSAERDIDRAIRAALAGRTVISIAHRLSVARDADRTLVLDGGRIAELGSHAELLATGGSYAELVSAATATRTSVPRRHWAMIVTDAPPSSPGGRSGKA
ncbi:MAG: ABC transporter ATP-binding protein [Haloechinothrix sp.]